MAVGHDLIEKLMEVWCRYMLWIMFYLNARIRNECTISLLTMLLSAVPSIKRNRIIQITDI